MGEMEELKQKQEQLGKSITLHGRAWLAVNAFVESVITEKELEEKFESEYLGGEFYPSKVISEAKTRLTNLYFEVQNLGGYTDKLIANETKTIYENLRDSAYSEGSATERCRPCICPQCKYIPALEQKVSSLEKKNVKLKTDYEEYFEKWIDELLENEYLMDCFGPWMDAVNEAYEECHSLEKEKAGLVEKVELRGNMIIALQDTCKRQMDELYEVRRNLKEALAKLSGGKQGG